MIEEAVFHVPYGAYAYALSSNQAQITVRSKRGDIKQCTIIHEDRYEAPDTLAIVPMSYRGSDAIYDYFQCTIASPTRRIRYRFLLDDGNRRAWYGEQGIHSDHSLAGWFQLAYLCTRDLFIVPEWVNNAIVYQIFPDRFANGDPTNDPEGTLPWGKSPTAHTFFGGDLAGVIEKLPYLEQLGVNLIYMTPIFLSPSTHKYDTQDYYQIDPMFGDIATCKRLVQDAHDRGIRVMLDAVFNHAGSEFFAFQDVISNGSDSPYVDWFHLAGLPIDTTRVNYETFANGIGSMPKLRTENPQVQQYLLEVAAYWIREIGIDGWRLDVANEVDHAFWRDFRRVVKEANPDALIIGEVWHDASPWLGGDQFDGVMNYLFRDAVVDFFAKSSIDAETFDERLTRIQVTYKQQANHCMFNLLGSHDTARFLTVCREKKERFRLAVIFQMTYVGIPEIYYGDEVGMVGETDPDCRRTMLWDPADQDADLLSLHRQLIAIRKEHTALQTGRYRTVIKDCLTNLYGFAREDDREAIYIYINNSPRLQSCEMPFGMTGIELLSGMKADPTIVLEPYSAKLIHCSLGE